MHTFRRGHARSNSTRCCVLVICADMIWKERCSIPLSANREKINLELQISAKSTTTTSRHLTLYPSSSVSILHKYLTFVLSLKRNTSVLQRWGNSPGNLPETYLSYAHVCLYFRYYKQLTQSLYLLVHSWQMNRTCLFQLSQKDLMSSSCGCRGGRGCALHP